MPRYLNVSQILELLWEPLGKSDEPAKRLGIPLRQARQVQAQWFCKIHGVCEVCGKLNCSCIQPRSGDNRDGFKVLDAARVELEKRVKAAKPANKVAAAWELYQFLEHSVDHIPCQKCGVLAPYTVRNALWRMSHTNAFFRCKNCWRAHKRRRKQDAPAPEPATVKPVEKPAKKTTKKKATKKTTKKVAAKKLARVPAKPVPEGEFGNRPFSGLAQVG
jgi:hypothetical protein